MHEHVSLYDGSPGEGGKEWTVCRQGSRVYVHLTPHSIPYLSHFSPLKYDHSYFLYLLISKVVAEVVVVVVVALIHSSTPRVPFSPRSEGNLLRSFSENLSREIGTVSLSQMTMI